MKHLTVWGWLDANKQTIGHRSNIRVSTKTIKGGGQWKVKGKEQKGVGWRQTLVYFLPFTPKKKKTPNTQVK